jgi:apolipoprotein N-acyltransferase
VTLTSPSQSEPARAAAGRVAFVVAGAGLYALAFPPFAWSALAWLTLVPLLLVVRGRSPLRAFGYGALYGFASAWGSTWWFAQAFSRYFASGMIAAGFAMSAAYAVAVASTFGLFAAGATVLQRRPSRWATPFLVAALWASVDLLRGRILGQPWVLLGYSQATQTGLIQVAALTGVYGVSFLVALGNAGVAEAVTALRTQGGRPRAVHALLLPALIVAAVWVPGKASLPRRRERIRSPRVVVVQANVPPAFRWTRGYAEQQLRAHLALTEKHAADIEPSLVVWPENALSTYLESDPFAAAQLVRLATRYHTDILLGAPRYQDGRTYNSARLIRASGRDGGHYDKQHLVMFAETSPLAPPAPAGPSESPSEFTAGHRPGVLQSFLPLGVSICHEVLYPDIIGAAVRDGAELLVNISNDGWLDGGYGAASRQHFAMAAFRAVETRRYLVRAATTGVSGVIDPWGRTVEERAPGTVGVGSTRVSGRREITPYVRFGDAFAFACVAAALAGVLRGRVHLRRRLRAEMPAPATA